MIKCNRCGNITPAGAVCQSCGAPLSSRVDNGFSPRTGGQDQPELPAWLESLRAGERPVAPANNITSFSPADLIEEGALPSWMRTEERENTGANPALSQTGNFSEQPDAGDIPARGLAASSLIDKNSLPSWMQEEKSAQPPSSPGSFSAGSLVQQDSMPSWMKTLQQEPPAAPGSAQQSSFPPSAQAAASSQPLQSPVSPSSSQPQAPAARPTIPGTPGQSFSARDLIDPTALPSWMQPSDAANNAPAAPANQRPAVEPAARPATPPAQPARPQGSQSGFSASSLLDMDSLPQWLRDSANQGGNRGAAGNIGVSRPEVNAPYGQAPTQMSANASPSQQEEGRVSASSFIDMNALPNWLRSSDQQGQGGNIQPATGSGTYNAYNAPGGYASPAARAENMRVPSRPRGEVSQTESSELAANVFASMLGVASSTPNFPASQTPPQAAANNPTQYASPAANMPSPQPDQNPYGQMGQASPANQANPYGQMGQNYSPNPYSQLNQSLPSAAISQTNIPNPGFLASSSSIPNPMSIPNTPSSLGGSFGQNYPNAASGGYGSMYGDSNGQPGANAPSQNAVSPFGGSIAGVGQPGAMHAPGAAGSATDDQKNKKRGIFEAIRDWLSR